MWDSGLRPVPAHVLPRARRATIEHARQTQLLPLSELATELGVHVRTLQAAARTGRLDVHFSEQSVFGRPRKVASRAAAERFIRTHYRRFAGQAPCPAPLPSVPPDYDVRLKILRSEFELSQPALARLIGAAGKAVVYQWESRKRTPSDSTPSKRNHTRPFSRVDLHEENRVTSRLGLGDQLLCRFVREIAIKLGETSPGPDDFWGEPGR